MPRPHIESIPAYDVPAEAVTAGLLAGTPQAGPWAVGMAEGFALAQLGDTRAGAEESWEKLMDTKPFWDRG